MAKTLAQEVYSEPESGVREALNWFEAAEDVDHIEVTLDDEELVLSGDAPVPCDDGMRRLRRTALTAAHTLLGADQQAIYHDGDGAEHHINERGVRRRFEGFEYDAAKFVIPYETVTKEVISEALDKYLNHIRTDVETTVQ